MTAAIGAEALGAGEAAAAGGGEAAAAAPKAAPSSSAPVGTARSAAGSSGSAPRTQRQLKGPAPAKSSGTSSKATSNRKGGKGGKTVPAIFRTGKGAGASLAGGRRLLMGEFITCAVIVSLSPLTDRHKSDTPGRLMKRNSAVAVLFLLLALVSAGGRGAARVAAALGGLVTVALLVSERDIFTVVAQRFNGPESSGPAGPPGSGAPAPGSGEGVSPGQQGQEEGPDTGLGIPAVPGDDFWGPLISGLGPI